jgi:hypothetical protein
VVGARIYVPVDQLADKARRAACGIGADVTFRTKPQLAIDICRDMVADHTMPPWCAGDEVYGRSSQLRNFLQDNGVGYVMRVGCAFHVTVAPGVSARADDLAARCVGPEAWQVRSVAGSKGERRYDWAWIATTSPRHYLLIRRHLTTGELAFHYCYVPEDRPATLMTLVRVACLRRPVEEDFEFGKDHFAPTTPRSGSTQRCRGIWCSPSPLWQSARSPLPKQKPAHPPRSCPPHPTTSHPMIPG